MGNYFNTIVFELCCSKRHLERSVLMDESASFSSTYRHIHDNLSSIFFSQFYHFQLYVFCFISLSPALHPLFPSVWQFLSSAHSVSQGSASQMSPLVTTSLIDLRTAKGIDLKQLSSLVQKKSFLLARLLMTWWNAPCRPSTYTDSLHESLAHCTS